MARRLAGGASLLGAAVFGIAAALVAPRRHGRRGGLAVVAAVGVLLTRDAQMVLTGVPARLRLLPRVMLYLELASAATAWLVGLAAWLRPTGRTRLRPAGSSLVEEPTDHPAARTVAALTFLLHTLRQAVYLTPGQGRRGAAVERDRGIDRGCASSA
jgi:hypothetical protein